MPLEFSARRHAAATVVGDRIVVYGGNLVPSSSSAVDIVEAYALAP